MTTATARVCLYADRNGVPVPPPNGAATVEDWQGGPDQAPWRPVSMEYECGTYEQQRAPWLPDVIDTHSKVTVYLSASQDADGSVEVRDEPVFIECSPDHPLSLTDARLLGEWLVAACDRAMAWQVQR
jgi:hypothetical protein